MPNTNLCKGEHGKSNQFICGYCKTKNGECLINKIRYNNYMPKLHIYNRKNIVYSLSNGEDLPARQELFGQIEALQEESIRGEIALPDVLSELKTLIREAEIWIEEANA